MSELSKWAVARGEGYPAKMMYDLQTRCGNGRQGSAKAGCDVIGGRTLGVLTSRRAIAVLALIAGRSVSQSAATVRERSAVQGRAVVLLRCLERLEEGRGRNLMRCAVVGVR